MGEARYCGGVGKKWCWLRQRRIFYHSIAALPNSSIVVDNRSFGERYQAGCRRPAYISLESAQDREHKVIFRFILVK